MDAINQYLLAITGAVCLEQKLDSAHRLKLSGEIELYSAEKRDNQDGTFDIKYKGKFVSGVETEQAGKKLLGAPKTKKSLQLRRAIYVTQDADVDQDANYERTMDLIIADVLDGKYKTNEVQ